MSLAYRTSVILALSSSIAMGQVIVPTSQDRRVVADAPGGTPDHASDSATDFGPFMASVSAGPGGGSMSGASQDSQILADSFVVSGVQSSSGSGASSESVASVDFDLAVKASYRASGSYESYDGGFFSYDLTTASGQFIDGTFGILEGPQTFDDSGQLDPGSYVIVFRAQGGGDFSFADFDAAFELTALSGSYCVGAPNSAGSGASLAVGGTQSIASNDFTIEAGGVVPSVSGLVFYGPGQIQAPFGDGFRCVGGQTFRLQPPVQAGPSGNLSKPIDFTTGPTSSGNGQITQLSTWNFQLWYRDPMGPGSNGFNTSEAVWVTFCQ